MKPITHMLRALFVVLAAFALASACAEDSSNNKSDGDEHLHALEVNTVSGGHADIMDTMWEVCIDNGDSTSTEYSFMFEEHDSQSSHADFASSDCSGTATETHTELFELEVLGDKSVSWADGTAPGSLSSDVTASKCGMTYEDGSVEKILIYVDDTSSHAVMYLGLNEDSSATSYPSVLDNTGWSLDTEVHADDEEADHHDE